MIDYDTNAALQPKGVPCVVRGLRAVDDGFHERRDLGGFVSHGGAGVDEEDHVAAVARGADGVVVGPAQAGGVCTVTALVTCVCVPPPPPPPPPGWVGRDVGLQALSASSKALFNRTPHGARGIAWCKQLRNAYEKWSQNNAERAVQRRHTRSEVAVGAEASSANSAVDTHVREGVENECEARSAACTPNSGENTSDPTARTLYDPTRFHPNLNIE